MKWEWDPLETWYLKWWNFMILMELKLVIRMICGENHQKFNLNFPMQCTVVRMIRMGSTRTTMGWILTSRAACSRLSQAGDTARKNPTFSDGSCDWIELRTTWKLLVLEGVTCSVSLWAILPGRCFLGRGRHQNGRSHVHGECYAKKKWGIWGVVWKYGTPN